MHKVLVNRLFKLAQVRLTDHPNMTIAVDWDEKQKPNQKKVGLVTLYTHFLS